MREETPKQRVKAVIELINMILEIIGRLFHECSLPNTSKLTSDELQMMMKETRVIVFKMNQNIMWNCLDRILFSSFSAKVSLVFIFQSNSADAMSLTVKKLCQQPIFKYLVAWNIHMIPKNMITAP